MKTSKQNTQLQFDKNPIKIWAGDFPGGPVDKSPPSIAGNMGLVPGQGTMIPHAVGQLLSPQARTTEPMSSGAHMPCLEGNLHAAMKIPPAATKTPRSPK